MSEIIGDRFELRRVLNAGGFGVVYEAHDGERLVALKLFDPSRLGDGGLRKAYFVTRSYQGLSLDTDKPTGRLPLAPAVLDDAARRVNGIPGVVPVIATGIDTSGLLPAPWIAAPLLVDAAAFSKIIAAQPLDPRRARPVLERVFALSAALHERGVPHGDIRAGRFLVGADGEVSLLDAGGWIVRQVSYRTWHKTIRQKFMGFTCPEPVERYSMPFVDSADKRDREWLGLPPCDATEWGDLARVGLLAARTLLGPSFEATVRRAAGLHWVDATKLLEQAAVPGDLLEWLLRCDGPNRYASVQEAWRELDGRLNRLKVPTSDAR